MASDESQSKRIYQDEHGRYQLPKDSPEHDRLDVQSAALVALMDYRPFSAPLNEPRRILDIGCGTGAMTYALATVFPDAQIIGIDLAPVPESRHTKLENVEFVQGDITNLAGQDPRFELESFDYVFERLLMFGMTEWAKHIASITRLVKPGGWLELQEIDMQLWSSNGDRLADSMPWYNKFFQDSTALGLDVEIAAKLNHYFQCTPALENVSEAIYSFPPKPAADRPQISPLSAQIPTLFAVVSTKVCSAKRTSEEVDDIIGQMRSRWIRDFDAGDHYNLHAVVGQKQN